MDSDLRGEVQRPKNPRNQGLAEILIRQIHPSEPIH